MSNPENTAARAHMQYFQILQEKFYNNFSEGLLYFLPPFQVLCPLYTLDVASTNITQQLMGHCQQSYRLPSMTHGLSHGLKIARQLSIFAPVGALVPPFQVLRRISEKSDSRSCRTFLAGALGLEPRAYGFGDRRSTN